MLSSLQKKPQFKWGLPPRRMCTPSDRFSLKMAVVVVVVALLFYVHGKQLRSCRDGQLT